MQKSDGGFLYATTDLAAVKQRVEEVHRPAFPNHDYCIISIRVDSHLLFAYILVFVCSQERADRILYVTDVGQSQHFEMDTLDARVGIKHVRSGVAVQTKHLLV